MKTPVADTVSFSEAPALELRLWSVQRLLAVMLATFDAPEAIAPGQGVVNVLRVVGPVGGDIQGARSGQPVSNERQERRRDYPPLVMPFLGPGIREVEIQSRQRAVRYLVCEYFDGVVINEAQVRDARLIGFEHAMSDAGLMYLDANEIAVRIRGSLLDQGLTIAETDLQNDGR
jgi:hypothetical protein